MIEAEFMALLATLHVAIWLKHFLIHLGVSYNVINLLQVNCDNQAVTAYTKDLKYHEKTKHVDIKFNFVKDMVVYKEVNMKHISTHRNCCGSIYKSYFKRCFH